MSRDALTKMTKAEVVVSGSDVPAVRERADTLIGGLRSLLEHSSGVMFVSHTYVSRAHYFA